MKIIKIKEIQWWDPKSRSDAVSYKVWVEDQNQTELKYFTSQEELSKFQKSLEPKIKKVKKTDITKD